MTTILPPMRIDALILRIGDKMPNPYVSLPYGHVLAEEYELLAKDGLVFSSDSQMYSTAYTGPRRLFCLTKAGWERHAALKKPRYEAIF